jgi:glycosyltransferase involved in cell wall biosynthesis
MKKTTVVIPAYEPDKKIETLVQTLIGRIPVLVVNDGSGGAYSGIFQAIEDMGAVVLHHTQNGARAPL